MTLKLKIMIKKGLLFVAVVAMFFATSCTSTSKIMKQPTSYVELNKDDFEFSDQVTGEASATYILMIDFDRLFTRKSGEVISDNFTISAANIPVIGNYVGMLDQAGQVKSYALYDMMEKNPGYDVVFYPQFEVVNESPIGIPFLICTTKVKATARLAKIKK